MAAKTNDTQTGRKLSRWEIQEILERNAELWKGDESFVTYMVELAMYLLEYEYDWSQSGTAPPEERRAKRPAPVGGPLRSYLGDPGAKTVSDAPDSATAGPGARARATQSRPRDPRSTQARSRETQARRRADVVPPAVVPQSVPVMGPAKQVVNKQALESFIAHAENLVKTGGSVAQPKPAAQSAPPDAPAAQPPPGAANPADAADNSARRAERQKQVQDLLKSVGSSGRIKTQLGKRACPHCGAGIADELICPMCFNLTR